MMEYFEEDPSKHIWHFYLDNKSLINQMEKYRNEQILPKWHLNPDADIVWLAHNHSETIPANFVHVKGHQEDNASSKMNRPAQLNNIADKLASEQREIMHKPAIEVQGNFCYLKIDDKYITKDTKKWILEAATKVPVQQFYKDKYHWAHDTFELINWTTQHKTLTSYDINDQRYILKFVHGWLPTYDRMRREFQTTTSRCPLCHYITETNLHLFACKHPTQLETLKDMRNYLAEDGMASGHKQLNEIISEVLRKSIDNQEWQPTPTGDPELDQCIRDQGKIGWHHIYFGRLAKSISQFIDHHHNNTSGPGSTLGHRWVRKLIQKLWDSCLKLWNHRNGIIYGKQESEKASQQRQNLIARVERCYQYQQQLKTADRDKIFYKTQEEMMKEDPRYIQSWLKLSERIIRIHKKEANKPNKAQHMMEQYVQWRPSAHPPRKRMRQFPRHQKQDLRPD
jgi:hypothetical protein